MKIQVTKEHIKNGVKSRACKCPITLAVKEKLNYETVRTSLYAITLSNNDDEYKTINLPLAMSEWISSYDNGFEVFPFEFELADDDTIKEVLYLPE